MSTVWDEAEAARLEWHPAEPMTRVSAEQAYRDAAELPPAFRPVPAGDPNAKAPLP